jgi:hypothetical protein
VKELTEHPTIHGNRRHGLHLHGCHGRIEGARPISLDTVESLFLTYEVPTPKTASVPPRLWLVGYTVLPNERRLGVRHGAEHRRGDTGGAMTNSDSAQVNNEIPEADLAEQRAAAGDDQQEEGDAPTAPTRSALTDSEVNEADLLEQTVVAFADNDDDYTHERPT